MAEMLSLLQQESTRISRKGIDSRGVPNPRTTGLTAGAGSLQCSEQSIGNEIEGKLNKVYAEIQLDSCKLVNPTDESIECMD